jgi:TonB family protein
VAIVTVVDLAQHINVIAQTSQVSEMLEIKNRPMVGNSQARGTSSNPQRSRLVFALVILVVALIVVVLKDQQFWFGSDESTLETDGPTTTATSKAVTTPVPATPAQAKSNIAKARMPAAKTAPQPKPADAPAVTTNRTVLPPLDVEVIAGDAHSRIHPGTNAARVEVPQQVTEQSALAAATNAAEHERMSVEARATATYPALAQHMNVQGSVVLQAVIGTDGVIQNLRVLSGPAILSAAAQQAVREWRFKPVVQDGQPVETKAKITVNFTIKVADGAVNTTLADSRASDQLIITR